MRNFFFENCPTREALEETFADFKYDRFFVQPYVKAFEVNLELKLYFVDGEFLFAWTSYPESSMINSHYFLSRKGYDCALWKEHSEKTFVIQSISDTTH